MPQMLLLVCEPRRSRSTETGASGGRFSRFLVSFPLSQQTENDVNTDFGVAHQLVALKDLREVWLKVLVNRSGP